MEEPEIIKVERVQTGVRIEKRLLKVLKAIAKYHDMALGNLMEEILLHAFEGASPFNHESLEKIASSSRSTIWITTPAIAIISQNKNHKLNGENHASIFT